MYKFHNTVSLILKVTVHVKGDKAEVIFAGESHSAPLHQDRQAVFTMAKSV